MLFQAAFIGRLAEEAGAFRLSQVIDRVHRKMVERHPHVFGDETLADAEAVRQAWERRKLRKEPKRESLFSGVPASLPALLGAYRLTQKAAGVGFDWPDAAPVLAKAEEEIAELREALALGEKDAGRDVERHGVPGDSQLTPGNPVPEQDDRARAVVLPGHPDQSVDRLAAGVESLGPGGGPFVLLGSALDQLQPGHPQPAQTVAM